MCVVVLRTVYNIASPDQLQVIQVTLRLGGGPTRCLRLQPTRRSTPRSSSAARPKEASSPSAPGGRGSGGVDAARDAQKGLGTP